MDTIHIKDNNDNIVLYFEDNQYWGYVFHEDGSVDPVDESIFKYFNMFKLSDDKTELPMEGIYRVFLDNKTNFKHYFVNDEEDYEKLFQNNGEECVLYKNYFKDAHRFADNEKQKKENEYYYYDEVEKPKGYVDQKTRITGLARSLLVAFMMANQLLILRPDIPICRNYNKFMSDTFYQQEDISVDYLKDKLCSSKYLSREEKAFLYNEDFLSDIVPIINQSNYSKAMIKQRFDNIKIVSFDRNDKPELGYYVALYPNKLFIADYKKVNFKKNKDTISHEFIHLCQEGYEYKVLIEACAAIMSYEYYDSDLNAYSVEQFSVRRLMETIGSYPVLEYVVNGNFQLIENNVKPLLTNEEYSQFLECLRYTQNDLSENNKDNFDKLNSLIDKMYKKAYNEDPSDNLAFKALESPYVSRYYFNRRKATFELSYYREIKETMTVEEAVDRSVIVFYHLLPNGAADHLTYKETMQYVKETGSYPECISLIDDEVTSDGKNVYIIGPKEYIMPFNDFGPIDLDAKIESGQVLAKQLKTNRV